MTAPSLHRGILTKLSIMTACGGSTSVRISACRAALRDFHGLPPAKTDRPTLAPLDCVQMKPTLQFRLSQHLTLTPQLQQSIRLLQLSTVELNQEIERMLMENPVLEREEMSDEVIAPVSIPPVDSASNGTDATNETPFE